MVKPLLAYIRQLQQLAKDLELYSPEVLAHLVLFEVFHHEFFHHMAESTATWLEIVGAALEDDTPVFCHPDSSLAVCISVDDCMPIINESGA